MIRNANIWSMDFIFLITTETSVQRTHYTWRFHFGNQITLTQILIFTQNGCNWTIYQHPITRTTNEERVFKFFTEHRKEEVFHYATRLT